MGRDVPARCGAARWAATKRGGGFSYADDIDGRERNLWITLWITVWIFARPLRPRGGASLISMCTHSVIDHLHRRCTAFHVKHRAVIDAVHATSWVAGRR